MALALARIIGGEHHYIRLWRATRADFGTAGAQAVMALQERMSKLSLVTPLIRALLEDCIHHLAGQSVDLAALTMGHLLDDLTPLGAEPAPELWNPTIHKLLRECAHALQEFKGARQEYLLLAFTALEVGIVARRRRKNPPRA